MKKIDKQKVLQAIAEEDELEEEMPEDVWAEISMNLAIPHSSSNSRSYIQHLMRVAVISTKSNIINRISEIK